jgi:LytS/YehU family sensor histidine kinase
VAINEEMPFINSYIFLLKTRFDQNLSIRMNISEKEMQKKVAPMVIQLLIENAIKHNVISSTRPLNIDIFTENEEYLVVTNNLQMKSSTEPSSGTGLDNIRKRYEYLSSHKVMIDESHEKFTVKIPLLD